MSKQPKKSLTVRLQPRLIERVQEYAERMKGDTPGVEFSQTDAVSALLTYALDDLELKRKQNEEQKSLKTKK